MFSGPIRHLYSFLLVSLLLCVVRAGAQHHVIGIRLMYAHDTTVVPFTKAVIKAMDGAVLSSALTDADGRCRFTLADSLDGKVVLYVQALGTAVFTSPLLSFATKDWTFLLTKNTVQLAGIQVFSRQLVKDAGKLVYKVRQDAFSRATSSAELLVKLPGISTGGGGVKLNGRPGVLILINGKGELKSQEQQLALLSALGADQIDKIEVMAFPSSRYDASVSSVLNVILKKERGISSVHVHYSQPLYMTAGSFGEEYASGGGSSNLNFRIGAARVALVVSASNTLRPEASEGENVVQPLFRYDATSFSRSASFRVAPNLSVDYDINKRSSISLAADLSFTPSSVIRRSEAYTFHGYTSTTVDSVIKADNYYRADRKGLEVSGHYKYLLQEQKGSYLYANLIYSHNPASNSNDLTSMSDVRGPSRLLNRFSNQTDVINASVILTDVIKTSFVNTEVGIKSNSLQNNTQQSLNGNATDFRYREQLSSLFASARWHWGKYLLSTELRGELLNSQSTFRQADSVDKVLRRDYFQLYPSLVLQYNFHDELSTSIGYTKRIRRPFVSDLNPTQQITGNFRSQSGNQLFMPSYTDRIEGQVLYKQHVLTLYYERASNRRVFVPTSNPFVFEAANLGLAQRYGVAISEYVTIGKSFNSNFNIIYAYSTFRSPGPPYHNNSSNLFEVSSSHEWTIGKRTRLQADIYYNARLNLEYSVYGDFISHSLTLRQLLWKEQLWMNISVSDPLGLEKTRARSYYPLQFDRIYAVNNSRSVALQLVYNFPFGQRFRKQTYKMKNDGEMKREQ